MQVWNFYRTHTQKRFTAIIVGFSIVMAFWILAFIGDPNQRISLYMLCITLVCGGIAALVHILQVQKKQERFFALYSPEMLQMLDTSFATSIAAHTFLLSDRFLIHVRGINLTIVPYQQITTMHIQEKFALRTIFIAVLLMLIRVIRYGSSKNYFLQLQTPAQECRIKIKQDSMDDLLARLQERCSYFQQYPEEHLAGFPILH